MAVVGDEIMVCDYDKCVMVYTKELKYVRSITSNGDGSGRAISRVGISSNQHGNVYISDPNKSSIHIFKNDGAFLRSFGMSVKLKSPLALCVSGQYVYVSDWDGHKIAAVFTTEGEHVATFGQKGSDKGDFNRPLGVCVDDDGFVYVCDEYNNRLQVF